MPSSGTRRLRHDCENRQLFPSTSSSPPLRWSSCVITKDYKKYKPQTLRWNLQANSKTIGYKPKDTRTDTTETATSKHNITSSQMNSNLTLKSQMQLNGKGTDIIQTMPSNHNGIKLEIKNRRIALDIPKYLEIKQHISG